LPKVYFGGFYTVSSMGSQREWGEGGSALPVKLDEIKVSFEKVPKH